MLEASSDETDAGDYPDVAGVIEPARKVAEEPVFRFAVNPKALYDLAQAMGTKNYVILSFPEIPENGDEYQQPISVTSDDPSVFGMIMPMKGRK